MRPTAEGLWRPLTLLAMIGLGPPLAIVSSSLDAHAAPAAIERPDTVPDTNAENHRATTPRRYISHADRMGPRRQM
ncbi:hypothetical protein [Streptomyces sp. NPDC093707]|uniref:hypothetical protein n=1 Tax=Streptomyces sp. NPDC093707 TaxID=3154984 RepID=UPI003450D408